LTYPDLSPDAEELRRAIEEDYSKWVAVTNIPMRGDTALAYLRGHAVPDTNVKLHGYDKEGVVVSRQEWDKQQREAERARERKTRKQESKQHEVEAEPQPAADESKEG
jgi:hypothetical protein